MRNLDLTHRTLCRLLSDPADVALTSTLGPDDWRLLAVTAQREGVAPLLYHTLNEAEMLALAPSGVQAKLRQTYYATTARNLLLYRELSRILTALRVSLPTPLPVIILKGAALAGTVYPNVALRPMGDVDVLIRIPDLPRVQEMLIAQGYTFFPDRAREFDRGFGRAKTFTRRAPYALSVDLHWRLLEWPCGQQAALLTEWLWSSAVERRVADISALVLSPEAQVLHLTSHLAKHLWGRLLWFYDIVQVLRCYEDELDWDLILDKASEFEILRALQVTLAKTVEVLARPPSVPPHSGGEVSPSLGPPQLWRGSMGNDKEILERVESARPSLRGKAAFALLTARDKHAAPLLSVISKDSLLHKARYLATIAFPSAEYMTECYQFSDRRKLPFYYAYRLGSWFYFLVRSLLSVLSQALWNKHSTEPG